ncbi:MAG: DUF5674 family protein, partial [Candidatus Omnitrophica bacterium]|nr:DUF5674 family protein [Candidatus Omnitrophota bacterium]
QPLSWIELQSFLGQPFEEMIKFVVDVDHEVLALGGELQADAERLLLEKGSLQKSLWGSNLYMDSNAKQWRADLSSFINIRPSQSNRSMEIQDKILRDRIEEVLRKYLP